MTAATGSEAAVMGEVGDFGEHGGGGVAEAKIGTDASADCRGPQIEYAQPFRQRIHGLQVGRQEARPSVYLLTVGHGHRILQLCAADLDIVAMAVCLHVECFTKTLVASRRGLETLEDGEPAGRRIGVVGGLTAVHIVVGMNVPVVATGLSGQLKRAVGNHLVHVHVQAGARSALQHVNGKLVGKRAVLDLQTGLLYVMGPCEHRACPNWVVLLWAQARFDGGVGSDERSVGAVGDAGDREVAHGSLGVDAPVHIGGNLHCAYDVVLQPRFCSLSGRIHAVCLFLSASPAVCGPAFPEAFHAPG